MPYSRTATKERCGALRITVVRQFLTLYPRDLIITGTPAGVGFGRKPPTYSKHGGVIDMPIPGLGSQKNAVKAAIGEAQ
jgi:ureidoglycolate lyase